jgi:hypothetical protein
MVRGLLWLPLLILFIWLAWAGWNEYQKLEAYRQWAAQFDQAKYDIYAVLGQRGDVITWGKPTRRGPVELHSFSLTQVTAIQVLAGSSNHALHPVDPEQPPERVKQVNLEFQFPDQDAIRIPFTELSLALRWADYLRQQQRQLLPPDSQA